MVTVTARIPFNWTADGVRLRADNISMEVEGRDPQAISKWLTDFADTLIREASAIETVSLPSS